MFPVTRSQERDVPEHIFPTTPNRRRDGAKRKKRQRKKAKLMTRKNKIGLLNHFFALRMRFFMKNYYFCICI